jgi:DNA-binding transcriptional regulator PaaX
MALRVKPTVTDQVLAFLSGVEDLFDVPCSMRQVVYRHEYEHFKLKKRRTRALQRERERVRHALWHLEKAEVITAFKKSGAEQQYKLTAKGWLKFALQYAPSLTRDADAASTHGTLTKGSYVVIFDIPEQYRRFRDTLRQILLNLGCSPLQKSIFITTSPRIIRFVARIIANCELEDRVKILLVKSIL